MTAEQNIIAAAIDLVMAADSYDACLAEFDDDPSACGEWAEAQFDAVERLRVAIQTAGIDWRDPLVRDRLRKGHLADVLKSATVVPSPHEPARTGE